MSYLCITAKHVEGFCLWPTKQTVFSVAGTPTGRDIVGELAESRPDETPEFMAGGDEA